MEVSKLTISKKYAKQHSAVYVVLNWIQKHPQYCRSTNAVQIARFITRSADIEGWRPTEKSTQATIQRMVRNQMLDKVGSLKRATYAINYMHQDIPAEILAGAPEETRRRVEIVKKGLNSNQHIDEVGCVVTENNTEEEERAKEEPTEEVKDKEEAKDVSSDASEEKSIVVPVEVQKDTGGKSISITITLNLNI